MSTYIGNISIASERSRKFILTVIASVIQGEVNDFFYRIVNEKVDVTVCNHPDMAIRSSFPILVELEIITGPVSEGANEIRAILEELDRRKIVYVTEPCELLDSLFDEVF